MPPGSLNITVSIGDEFPGGWTLRIGGRADQPDMGKTAAVLDIGPGMNTVIIEGTDADGKKKRAEQVVQIPAADVFTLLITLE